MPDPDPAAPLASAPTAPQSRPTIPTGRRRRPARTGALVGLLGLIGLLAACGGRGDGLTGTMAVPRYPGQESFVWCVPYARFVSGVAIRGDADTWWDQARGHYGRGNRPHLGAVLTLQPDDRLRSGHVAVVTAIDGPRAIRVSHANWGWDAQTRGRIYEQMPALDVSAANDWTEVRFRHPATGQFGRSYPALGFIYPDTRVAAAEPATVSSRGLHLW